MGKTYQSIEIKVNPITIWEGIRNFQKMDWAPNVITSVEKTNDIPGDTIGSSRILNGAFKETLTILDDANMTFSYNIDDGPSPLSKEEIENYVGVVKVTALSESGGTKVEWTSSWQKNDYTVHEFCHNIYLALLHDMKKTFES